MVIGFAGAIDEIKTPLMLGALFAVILFYIFRQIIDKNIFPSLTKAGSFVVIRSIIDRLFWLSLLALSLGFIAYIYPIIYPPSPPKTSLSEVEQTLQKLENDAALLWGSFEAINSHPDADGEHKRKVQNEAVNLGLRLESLGGADNKGLLLDAKVQKYSVATLSFVMAASVQESEEGKSRYADKAITDGNMAIRLMDEVRNNADSGRAEDQRIQQFIQDNKRREYVLYLLAVAHAIKVRVGYHDLIDETWQLIDAIPRNYKASYPPSGDINLKWFMENNPK